MICRESKVTGSEFLRSFYKGSGKASFDVELDMAVEEPDTCLCQYPMRINTFLLYPPGLSALNLTTA